jgi:beta-lactamase superfamily II metal-dependent hydrolase
MPGHLAILDVGHGNAAILRTDDWVAVIDAGPGNSLVQYLVEQGVTRIDEVLISHADEDHLAGLVGVLSSGQFSLGRVRLNSDAVKDSKIWMDLTVALDDAARNGAIDFRPSLTASDNGQFDHGPVSIEILAPTNFLATRGPGSTDRSGRRITTNSISAVIRVAVNGQRLVLLAGDVDEIGLDELAHVGTTDLGAPILVFPHHGGRAGTGNPGAFTTRLSQMVQPTCVVFSIGRGIHGTPIPAVVEAIKRHGAHIRVACTQLSERCAATTPNLDPTHLNPAFARGREKRQCCAGTVVVDFQALGTVLPDAAVHVAFIQANAPTSLCLRA